MIDGYRPAGNCHRGTLPFAIAGAVMGCLAGIVCRQPCQESRRRSPPGTSTSISSTPGAHSNLEAERVVVGAALFAPEVYREEHARDFALGPLGTGASAVPTPRCGLEKARSHHRQASAPVRHLALTARITCSSYHSVGSAGGACAAGWPCQSSAARVRPHRTSERRSPNAQGSCSLWRRST